MLSIEYGCLSTPEAGCRGYGTATGGAADLHGEFISNEHGRCIWSCRGMSGLMNRILIMGTIDNMETKELAVDQNSPTDSNRRIVMTYIL